MARNMAPAKALAKWLGTPVVLAAAGYFVVGPLLGHLGKHLPKQVVPLVTEAEDKIPAFKQHGNGSHPVNADSPATDANTTSDAGGKESSSSTPEDAPKASTTKRSRTQTDDNGPDVEVSVHSATSSDTSDSSDAPPVVHHTKRRKHKPAKPKNTDPEMTDPASFGGTQDGGSTPPPTSTDGN